MTAPQSLTEEQIELLASLPIEKEPLDGVGHEVVLQGMGFVGISENRRIYYLTRAGEVLLATLQAERERERERVNGLAALLADHTQDLTVSAPSKTSDLWEVYGLPDAEIVNYGDSFLHALENAADNQENYSRPLSPDVLGDQKDKGKAALTAPERDKPVEVSEPSAADGLPMGPNELCRALVYVAGPYTNPDPVVNTRNAVAVGLEVYRKTGHAVIIPHLTLIAHMVEPHDVDFWYEFDLAQVRHCGALIRIPGDRSGADREVEFAKSLGIPVFHSVDEFGQALAFG